MKSVIRILKVLVAIFIVPSFLIISLVNIPILILQNLGYGSYTRIYLIVSSSLLGAILFLLFYRYVQGVKENFKVLMFLGLTIFLLGLPAFWFMYSFMGLDADVGTIMNVEMLKTLY